MIERSIGTATLAAPRDRGHRAVHDRQPDGRRAGRGPADPSRRHAAADAGVEKSWSE